MQSCFDDDKEEQQLCCLVFTIALDIKAGEGVGSQTSFNLFETIYDINSMLLHVKTNVR